MFNSNVKLVSYEDARDFANNLDIGTLEFDKHLNNVKRPITCMHASVSVIETLKLIVHTKELF